MSKKVATNEEEINRIRKVIINLLLMNGVHKRDICKVLNISSVSLRKYL